MLDKGQKKLALALLQIGAVRFGFKRGWRLKLHEKYKDSPSLLYVGLRLLQSYLIRFTVLSACAFSSLLVVHDDSRRSPSIRFQDHDDENGAR
jgi:hypothetical protein